MKASHTLKTTTVEGLGTTQSVLILLVTTVLVGTPLFLGRVLGGHDIVFYLINAQQTAENLRLGELFPAWAGGFNAGYGAPTLLFFPPLTSYLHALPILLGQPVIMGVSGWSLVGLFLSGLAMFFWLRTTGVRQGALPAALVYILAPYRIVDLYHRSALAEHWAFLWPPLILWVGTSPNLSPIARVPLMAFLVAGLLLSNIPLAVLFGAGLAVWFGLSTRVAGQRPAVLCGVALGFLISAFALVPQALSSSLLAVDRHYGAQAGRLRPSANTLFAGDFVSWDFNTQLSLLVVVTFVLVAVSFFLLAPDKRKGITPRMILMGSVLCVLVATKPAGQLWDLLPIFSKLQFPWRVASLLTFGLALIVAYLDRRRGWLLVLLVTALSLSYGGGTRTLQWSAFSAEEPDPSAAGSLFPDPRTAWEAGSGGWYWRHENLAEIWFLAKNAKPFLLPELAGNSDPALDSIRYRPAVVLEDPMSPVRVVVWTNTRRVVEVSLPAGGTLLWRAINFPDMEITIDGTKAVASTDPTTGLVTHPIPSGEHIVEWSWRPFPALRWARGVSIIGLLFAGGLLLTSRMRPDPGPARSD